MKLKAQADADVSASVNSKAKAKMIQNEPNQATQDQTNAMQ